MQVYLLAFMSLLLLAVQAAAFDPPIDTAGPITARIDGPSEVTTNEKPFSISVVLENKGEQEIKGDVEIGLIDDWKAQPKRASFSVSSKGNAKLEFKITPSSQTYNAHYPVHAFVRFKVDGRDYEAHPILILRTNIPNPPKPKVDIPWKPFEVKKDSALALWRLPVYRVILRVFGEKPQVSPVGVAGTDPRTRASCRVREVVRRGGVDMEVIGMHPPWFNNLAGTIMIEFPIKLPKDKPIVLRFANAIRDNLPTEPPSDGVTFRVRVLPFSAPDGEEGKVVYEKHTLAKVWDKGEVDLSDYAGQAIRLQLESHPGPKKDTTCDDSYWAEPTLIVGTPPQRAVFPPSLDSKYLKLGSVEIGGRGYEVRIWEGKRGIFDSVIGFVGDSKSLLFNGFRVRVLGDDLSDWRSASSFKGVKKTEKDGHLIYRHSFSNWLGDYDLLSDIWIENGALRVKFWLENVPPARPWLVVYIEDISLGEWSEEAKRIYAGDGNVLVEPRAFNLWFDGHQLSTSFVGFDFKNGLSLVEGVDAVPNNLEVSPERKLYTLHTPHNQVISLIPAETAWQGAKVWREINGLKPAGGVKKLAGRFVFDLWGGMYRDSAEALKRAFRYGLTDSIVVWHNWQRWGYDYRLPDIYPPNPQFGTFEDFLYLVNTCKSQGVLFAPHDNYIDFYPDAEGFTYKRIVFFDGNPVRAWLNGWRGAQSYRWRADQVFPFLERNLKLIKEGFAPTAYFIDVWSCICPYDYWTYDGKFYTRLYTREVWGKAFAWIRDFLGDSAPQISESGHDQLIGWLDGGQTNHLRVDIPPPGYYGWAVWPIQCRDAERIPWYDMAHHSKFALHGAGYEGRYVAGLDTRLHGIYSDDYIATEVLTGHPAMVPAPFGRDVVRKYWLLHDLMRALALKEMEDVQFADGDIHRQFVRWNNGGEVWVNRGKVDWEVEGHILPEYGVYARVPVEDGVVEMAIERKDGVIVDWSRSPSMLFVNARPVVSGRLPVKVSLESLKYLGNREAELTLLWEAKKPLPKDMYIFVHFVDKSGEIMFQADHMPPIPTTQWEGTIRSSARFSIPDKFKAGEEFEMRVGLYDTKSGERASLEGYDDGTGRIRLGKIKLEGSGNEITSISWAPLEEKDPVLARLNPQGKMIDFQGIRTNGAFRLTREGDALLLVPLPDSPQFNVRINWNALPWRMKRAETVEEIDEEGKVLRSYPLNWEGDEVVLTCGGEVFAYRLR